MLDEKKAVRKTNASHIRKEYGGKAFLQAVCKPAGTKLEFRFLSGDSQPGKVHLKTGIGEQLDRKVKVIIGPSLDGLPKKLAELKSA